MEGPCYVYCAIARWAASWFGVQDVATGDTGPASTGGFLQRSGLDQRREGDMERPSRITQYANPMSSPSVLLDADIAAQCP